LGQKRAPTITQRIVPSRVREGIAVQKIGKKNVKGNEKTAPQRRVVSAGEDHGKEERSWNEQGRKCSGGQTGEKATGEKNRHLIQSLRMLDFRKESGDS